MGSIGRIRGAAFLGWLALFLACSIKNPVRNEAVVPVVSDLGAPDTLFIRSSTDFTIRVKVVDPQGWEDIALVLASLVFEGSDAAVWSDTLIDDGQSEDILPRDGVFFGTVDSGFAPGRIGAATLEILAQDQEDHEGNIITASVQIEDAEKNEPPILGDPAGPDSLVNAMADSVVLSVPVSDPQGPSDIDSVWVDMFPPLSPTPVLHGRMQDDGSGGDVSAGDGVFVVRLDLGSMLDEIPVVTAEEIPATVSRNAGTPFRLSVRISHPGGLQAIRRVFFNTYKPDETPSSGNPFLMYDDGDQTLHGDLAAGDGVYSLLIAITPQSELGTYRFEFTAESFGSRTGQTAFRFQAADKSAGMSRAKVIEIPSVFSSGLSDPLVRNMLVTD